MTTERPVILAVDDDPQVLAAVSRDLRKMYGERFRIVRADGGRVALMVLDELTLAGGALALVVADQRMPEVSGIELLAAVRVAFPGARLVLLTAYADTNAAITAINDVHLDYYVMKPWEPPDERLYPILDELLDDWEANFHPPFAGIRVVGHRWSPDALRIRDFLARNLVPFRWLDVDADAEESARIIEAASTAVLPLVVLPEGDLVEAPTNEALGRAIGLQSTSEAETFDLLIVGGGPAGLAAAVYGASEGLATAVLERGSPGGQAGSSSRIENYLGFPTGVTGADLTRRALDQAKRLGAEVLCPVSVVALRRQDQYLLVDLEDGTRLVSTALVLASGVSYRHLDIVGAEVFAGSGLFYGASLHEARGYAGEDVVLVGGANSAGQAALHFARFARQVTMLVRGKSLASAMSAYLVHQIEDTENIAVRLGTEVTGLRGSGHLEQVDVIRTDGQTESLSAVGLFVFIGAQPQTGWLGGVVALDDHGFVVVGPQLERGRQWKEERPPLFLETSVPGVFAAGDIRSQSVKRVAAAVGDGALVVHLVHQYLRL